MECEHEPVETSRLCLLKAGGIHVGEISLQGRIYLVNSGGQEGLVDLVLHREGLEARRVEDVLHGAQLDPVEEKACLEAPQLEGEPVARVSDVIVSCYSGRERESEHTCGK